MREQRNVFICHASEDKAHVVIPLTQALKQAKISYWFDQAEIKWGDSLTQKVNEGLSISRYIIVVLSKAFLSKNWPKRELNSALNIEASSGEVLVLPLLVGNVEDRKEILEKFPLLNDKLYISWNEQGISKIINALEARLSRNDDISHMKNLQAENSNEKADIPMPRIKKRFSELDKDKFLKEAFNSVRTYFRNALSKLKSSNPEIKTDITDIHNFKFICKIYIHGEARCSCKIWIGGVISSNSIAYSEGNISIDSDSSLNDWLTVESNEYELGLKPSGMWSKYYANSEEDFLNIKQASKYLWRRFTESLNY